MGAWTLMPQSRSGKFLQKSWFIINVLDLLNVHFRNNVQSRLICPTGYRKRDLVFECAHNLGLTFMLSGNYEAAKEVTEKVSCIIKKVLAWRRDWHGDG